MSRLNRDTTVGAMLRTIAKSKMYIRDDGTHPTAKEMMAWLNENPAQRGGWLVSAWMAARSYVSGPKRPCQHSRFPFESE